MPVLKSTQIRLIAVLHVLYIISLLELVTGVSEEAAVGSAVGATVGACVFAAVAVPVGTSDVAVADGGSVGCWADVVDVEGAETSVGFDVEVGIGVGDVWVADTLEEP
jgi:hypothetical protein